MKALTLLPLCACLVLAGCANTHAYTKSGANDAQTQTDIDTCRKQANPYSSREEAKEVFDKCMAAKGYDKEVVRYGY